MSEARSFSNIATEIILKENAVVNFNIFQGQGDNSFHLNNTKIHQHSNSRFKCNTITLCGELVRNDLNIEHKGEGCETTLNGLYMPDKKQHFDNHVFVNHAKPHCVSNQMYRGVIDNKASAVFLGKVLVTPDAQKTDANQSNKNILLSDTAIVNSKPQLEIYADDVKCSHGSTTGQLDKEALFYMQARGISFEYARIMLLNAFASEVTKQLEIKPFRSFVDFLVEKRLGGQKIKNQCTKLSLLKYIEEAEAEI